MSNPKLSIPKTSWLLVTGATSFVASHIINQFLERGYRVRGTVRQFSDASWITDEVFKSYADSGSFALVSVPDIAADHAFNAAIKGVSAIVHVATIGTVSTLDSNPSNVIPQTVGSTTSILHAALQEPSVQQFVYTSSCSAACLPSLDDQRHVERDTWNEEAVQLAWAPPSHGPEQGFIVYSASKVAAEKAVWKFVEDKKPHFSVNMVSPGTVFGEPLHKNYSRSTCSWVTALFDGHLSVPDIACAVDVKDIALLHVAAVLDPDVDNARLQAWGRACNLNDVFTIMRNLRPEHQFVPNVDHPRYLMPSTDTSVPFALMKKWGSQNGWRPLEDTLRDNLVFSRD